MTNPINQQFPNPNVPVVAPNGCLATPWRYFFDALWRRTGGATGTNGYFAFLNGDQGQPFQVSTATTATEATPLAQVQSLDATVLSSAETFATNAANTAQSNAEAFATSAANTAQSNAETFATGAANTAQSNAETYAAAQAATAQSNAETYASAQASTAQSNAETYALNQIQGGTGASFASVTVGSSPFTYSATAVGHLAIVGGTVTSVEIVRGSSNVTLSSGPPLVPMDNGDSVVITYSAAPTMTWLPR